MWEGLARFFNSVVAAIKDMSNFYLHCFVELCKNPQPLGICIQGSPQTTTHVSLLLEKSYRDTARECLSTVPGLSFDMCK